MCRDGLHSSNSDTDDNISIFDDGQDKNNQSDSDGPDSDWEDTYDDIPDFGFGVNSSGVKLDIPNGATAFDVFSLIWDDDEVMNLILKSSNEYGKKIHNTKRPHTKNSRSKNYNEISIEELQKFFGLCLLRAELGIPILRNCFGTNPLNYHPIFNYTMSGRRFKTILSCLNCSEGTISTDDTDRLRKISTLFNLIITKFQNSYVPTQNLSLDESMLL